MMLWKAADQRHPPVDSRDIRSFGWDVKEGGVVTPSVSNAPVAHGLLDIVSCSCSAERKACSEKRCSSHSAGLSCTEYCYCEGRCVMQSILLLLSCVNCHISRLVDASQVRVSSSRSVKPLSPFGGLCIVQSSMILTRFNKMPSKEYLRWQ